MALRQTILEAQKTALKEGNKAALASLRLLWSAIRNSEIDKGRELEENEVEEIIARQVKQLKDALVDFEKGNRADLVEQTQAEVNYLITYLPKQIDDAELEHVVRATLNLENEKNPGQLMGAVMKQVKGRADGKRVREMVEKILGGK